LRLATVDETVVNFGLKTLNIDRLPDLAGKSFLVTGSNQGLGCEASL
jgi:hypothetical protein